MSDKRKIIRKNKLQELVDSAGSIANFCRNNLSKDADKPIDPSYVSQLLNGTRNFSEEAARNMEKRAGLPEYYFDIEELKPNTKTFHTDNEAKQFLMSIVLALPDTDLDMEMIALIKEALSTKRQNIVKTKNVLSALNQDTPPYNASKDETKIINGE